MRGAAALAELSPDRVEEWWLVGSSLSFSFAQEEEEEEEEDDEYDDCDDVETLGVDIFPTEWAD